MKWSTNEKGGGTHVRSPIPAKRATRACFTCGRQMAAKIDESDVMCRKCSRLYRKRSQRAAKQARGKVV